MINPHPLCGAAFSGLRVGLLGGSFNPAHAGHLAMSLYALKRLKLDQVWWLVSPQNPLKAARGMASLKERVTGARKVATHPRIIVTDIERDLGTRYTVDTLRVLRQRFGQTRFVWLMGADNLEQMPRWHKWEDIFKTVPVAVFRRPAYAAGKSAGKAAQRFAASALPVGQAAVLASLEAPVWMVLDNPLNGISATAIRKTTIT